MKEEQSLEWERKISQTAYFDWLIDQKLIG